MSTPNEKITATIRSVLEEGVVRQPAKTSGKLSKIEVNAFRKLDTHVDESEDDFRAVAEKLGDLQKLITSFRKNPFGDPILSPNSRLVDMTFELNGIEFFAKNVMRSLSSNAAEIKKIRDDLEREERKNSK